MTITLHKSRFLPTLLGLCIFFSVGCNTKGSEEEQQTHMEQSYQIFPKITPETVLPNLSLTVRESSGLIYVDGQLWTLNDSGNDPELYQLDTATGKILRVVPILDAMNFDWEALTFDSNFIYIGDTGNNRGMRMNLAVYRIPRAMLTQQSIPRIEAEKISYQYEDQKVWSTLFKHNFDCEAFITSPDSIYFLTKNRADFHTNIYAIPNQPGHWEAQKLGDFNSHGQITEATQWDDSKQIALLGYIYYPQLKKNKSFIWLFEADAYPQFWKSQGKRWNLELNRQTEAISFADSNSFFISSERSNFPSASVYKVVVPAQD